MVHAHSSGIKAVGSWDAVNGLQQCRECCGGQGYRSPNAIGQLRSDADMYTTGEGDNIVLMQQVTRFLYYDVFLKQLSKKQFSGILEYLPSIPLNLALLKTATIDDVYNSTWQRRVLEIREGELLNELASKVGNTKDAVKKFDTWNRNLPLVIRVAQAHIDRILHIQFVKMLECLPEDKAPIRHILEKISHLDVLNSINKDLGWFVASGSVNITQAKQFDDIITGLCTELRPYSFLLVDAFGIPEKLVPLRNDIE